MADNSKIEWTDATFNPWIGCTKVSDGCKHCYAEVLMDTRYGRVKWGVNGTRQRTSEAYWRKPLAWNHQAEKAGIRKKVFCASLADIFEDKPELVSWRKDLWNLVGDTPNLDWLILTKRPENVFKMIPDYWKKQNAPDNFWLGFSAEDQDNFDKRFDYIAEICDEILPRIIFLSAEPLLEPIKISWDIGIYLDWVIVGGESQKGCRSMNPDWARSLHDNCKDFGIPFFMKQLGGYPDKRHNIDEFPEDLRIREFPDAH